MLDGLQDIATLSGGFHVAITVTHLSDSRTRGAVLFKAAEIDGRTRFLRGFVSSALLTGNGVVVEIARWTSREAYLIARATPAYAEQLAILGDFASREELVFGPVSTWPDALAAKRTGAIAVALHEEGADAAPNGGSEVGVLVVTDPNRRRVGSVLTGPSAETAADRGKTHGSRTDVFGPLSLFSTFNRPGPEEGALAYTLAPDPGEVRNV